MARSLWSGSIGFGLVSIPVTMHSALDPSEHVHFRMLHRKDLSPIRYKKICSKEDEEVPNDEIVRGYEVRKGKFAVVEDEELEEVQEELGEGERRIEIAEFVEFSSLNPLLFEKPYYLAPGKGGAKAYGLLLDALVEAKRVGIARFYMRTRPILAAVVPASGVLALEVIRQPTELRDPKSLKAESARVGEKERKMALALIEQMSGEWDPTEHPNVYRKALEKLLATKRATEIEEPAKEGKAKGGKVVDLMEALRRSVADTGRKARRPPARAKATRHRERRSA
jgi:DNA end-binding protein Ku